MAPLQTALRSRMGKLTRWWDQFAAATVEAIEAFSGAEAYDSAREVAEALKAFHQAGAAAGDIALLAQAGRAFQFAQGLCAGRRRACGKSPTWWPRWRC